MSHNVPAVYDDFATRISETEGFAGLQNCGGDKTTQRRQAPTVVFRSPSRFSGEAYTVLLYAVWAYTVIFYY